MAPNKRKRKGPSNPGRGFATTSIPSKTKSEEQKREIVESAVPLAPQAAPDQPPKTEDQQLDHNKKELTPEEFEHQLEESDLQLLVEKHGERSKKNASHQASKLITEKRLLRPQTEPLVTRQWLPQELMDLILSYVEIHFEHDKAVARASGEVATTTSIPDDEMVVRVWTVELALIQIGFAADQARSAVRYLVDRVNSGLLVAAASKESIWGLNECMDWLALTYENILLPSYDAKKDINSSRFSDDKAEEPLPEEVGMVTSALMFDDISSAK